MSIWERLCQLYLQQLVYNENVASGIGYYYWSGTAWVKLIDATSNADNDWHEVGTSTSPDNINDDVFTNGNVGIGVAVPQSVLHIKKAMSPGDVAQLKIENASGSALWIGQNHSLSSGYSFLKTHANEDLYFQVGQNTDNTNPDVVFLANGKVGIGMVNPLNTLVVGVNNSTNTSVTVEGYGASKPDINALLFGSDFGGLIQGGTNGHLVLGIRENESSDGVLIASGGGNYNSDQIYDTPVMFAKADGRVGFGTVSPSTRVHMKGETFRMSSILAERIETTSAGPGFFGRHARGTIGSETAALNGDNAVSFGGVLHDGASFNTIGFMNFYANGDQTAANHAGNFRIRLAQASGATASTMTILSNGNTGLGLTNPVERLDVNGDLYVRGDDIYFSHDAVSNANNDYVHFNDINTLNFGGRSMFSFHADVPRNDPAHDWSNPTGSISFDGAYATGKIGMNTTSPQASLDIQNGYAITDRFWYADYEGVNTNNPKIVLGRDGNPLPLGFVGMLFCSITGTSSPGTAYWMVKRYNNGTVLLENIASFGSVAGTTPEIYNDGGVIKIRLYSHTTNLYNVRVRTEQMW